jgi:hypothetical protein
MPNVDATLKPRQLKDISFIIDKLNNGAEYRKAVQSFVFTPTLATSSTQGGTPDAIWSDTVVTGWTLSVKFLQDAESLGSLTDYLFVNKGVVRRVDFVPYGGTGWAADVVLPAPPIGGDIAAWLADTVTMAVRGAPYRTTDDVTTPQQ